MSWKRDEEKTPRKIEVVDVTVTEEALEPPEPGLTSKFDTIQDWLIHLCETENPKTPIAVYNFGLFESDNDYVLTLVGLNTKEESKYNSITTIDFQPADLYYKIPTPQTEGHTRDQVIKKINNELNEFLKSEKFKVPFLSTLIRFTLISVVKYGQGEAH